MRPSRTLISTCRRAAPLVAMAGLSILTGCGDGRIARYPVKGTVLVDGKPAEGAMVIFCPVEGPPELMRERPFDDMTDVNGQYVLRTFQPGDGAPAGEYRVMVRWMATNPGQTPTPGNPDEGQPVFDRLKNKYFNPQSSVTATVEETENEIPPFELTSK